LEKIIIYCDGACSGNQFKENRGGWGALLIHQGRQKEICGGERNTTNNRMELRACIEALACLKKTDLPVEVYTDSAYLCNCIDKKWYVKWERNGWMNAQKQPVENQDLWVRLLALKRSFDTIRFIKVKGHSGVEHNETADRLANKGMSEMDAPCSCDQG
jgi:ribonuclease HI